MDEKKVTLAIRPEQDQDEIKLDLQDLLAALLLKWKVILAFLLIGAILGSGISFLKGNGKKRITEETLAKARSQIAIDRAILVDQLYLQYVSYKKFQEDMRSYYSTFASSDVSLNNTVRMRSEYYIISTIKDLDTVFINMALTEGDYQAMREIAPDEEAGATIYDRVTFTTAYNENKTTTSTIKIPVQESMENAYLIDVELYGNTEKQCREMMAVIEKAFRRQTEALRVLDPDIKLEDLGEQFDYNVADYVHALRKKNLDRMTTSEGEMVNLKNKVNQLNTEEKTYYDLMLLQYEETFAVKKHISWKKWMMIGAFLGAAIAASGVLVGYFMDGKIKAAAELEQNSKLLNRVFFKGKKDLFGKWATRLIHADETDPAVKADMVATDINILMEKNGKHRLMLLCSGEDTDASVFAEQVKTRLQEKNGELEVCIGNPMNSVEELKMAAQADMSVAFAEMKKSKRAMLREWRQVCERYMLPLAGSVAVQRCW